MAPKILLVNYSQKDADVVERDTGLKVLRGYISEIEGYTVEHDGTEKPNIRFYSPEAYYECAMTFVNLPSDSDLKTEFDQKARELIEEDMHNMLGYWKSKGQLLIIFAGNTNIDHLRSLGVPMKLKASSGNDTRTDSYIGEGHELHELVNMLERQIKMPTDKYILGGLKKKDAYNTDPYYSLGTKWHTYIANANGDNLVCSLSKGNDDYHGEEPGVIVMPQTKKISTTTTKIAEFFGEHYGIYRPGADWQDSDEFYPQAKLRQLTKEIAVIRADAEAETQAKQTLIDAHKHEWSFLRQLVTEQGDKLVDAVYDALTSVLGLKVVRSDEETKAEPIEDLLIELDKRKILLEVKGTTKSNPPLEYTQQPFQHIVRRNYDGQIEAGLILNHDMKKDPQHRKSAYTDKDKEGLISNLYFIDTRTLLSVAVAVIDGELTKEKAIDILFGTTGRVVYDNNSQL